MRKRRKKSSIVSEASLCVVPYFLLDPTAHADSGCMPPGFSTFLKVSSCDVSLVTVQSDDGVPPAARPRRECHAHGPPPGNHPCSKHERYYSKLAPGWGASATYLRQPG